MKEESEFSRDEVLYTGLYSVVAFELLDKMLVLIDRFVHSDLYFIPWTGFNYNIDNDTVTKFWTKYNCAGISRLRLIGKLKFFIIALNDETHEIVFVTTDKYVYHELMLDFKTKERIMATLGEFIYGIVTSIPACNLGLAHKDLEQCKIIASFLMKQDVVKMYDKSLVDEVIGCPNDVVTAESIRVLNDNIRQIKTETAVIINDIKSRYASKISSLKEMIRTLEDQKNIDLDNANSSMMHEISKIRMSIGQLNNASAGVVRQVNIS